MTSVRYRDFRDRGKAVKVGMRNPPLDVVMNFTLTIQLASFGLTFQKPVVYLMEKALGVVMARRDATRAKEGLRSIKEGLERLLRPCIFLPGECVLD